MHDRFFDSTRGKIVGALRERRSASAFDLAEQFGLSPNAIRQQLVILERDGLIAGRSVRRGRTKPTVEYSLTQEASRYFPQRYDKMLNAVLREIRTAGGDPYTVFTPFHRNWLRQPRRDVLGMPATLPPPGASRGFGRLPSLRSLGIA